MNGGDGQRLDFSPLSSGGSGRAASSDKERMLGGDMFTMNGAAGAGIDAGKGMEGGGIEVAANASSAGPRYMTAAFRPVFLAS